jgi:hypothetical protein
MLVRNLVNVNLLFPGNILTYILVTTKKSVDTQECNIRSHLFSEKNTSYVSDDEEGNKSQFEQDTVMSSKNLFDLYGLIKIASNIKTRQFLEFYHFNKSEYYKNVEYYTKNVFQANQFNTFLVCMFFAESLGGSQSIYILEYNDYMKLVVLLQQITALLGFPHLSHMLTMTESSAVNIGAEDENVRLKMNYNTSTAYQICKNRFENSIYELGGSRWDDAMVSQVSTITEIPYVYNTAPGVGKMLNVNVNKINQTRFQIPLIAVEELCTFVEHHCEI